MRQINRLSSGYHTTVLVVLVACWGLLIHGQAADERGFTPEAAEAATDTAPKRRALCIGIDGYPEGMGYGPLNFAAADAKAMAEVFTDLGYETTLMVDDLQQEDRDLIPTYENMRSQLKKITRASTNPNDTLIIFFAGHGDQIAGQSVFIPLDYAEEEDYLTIGELFDALNHPRCKANKKLLILDACRSSGQAEGRMLSGDFLKSFAGVESLVVLSGCGVNQRSYEDKEIGHGRLTAALMEGLRGAAFEKDREFLFGHELFTYTGTTFKSKSWLDEQTPVMFGKWDAKVRFDLAWRSLPDPPPITDADAEVFEMTMGMARTKAGAGDFTSGVKYATTALRILDRHPDALAWRAWCHYQLGNTAPAFRDAQLAVEQAPAHPLARRVLGGLAFGRDDFAVAQADLAVAVAGADQEAMRPYMDGEMIGRAWFEYAYSLLETRAPLEEGLAAYQRVVDNTAAPRWERVASLGNMAAGHATLAGNWQAAIDLCTQVIEMPDPPQDLYVAALNNRGMFYQKLSQWDKANDDLQLVLETPNASIDQRVRAATLQGYVLTKMGEGRRAYMTLSAAIEWEGVTIAQQLDLLVQRGSVLTMLKYWDKAVDDFTLALKYRDRMTPDRVASALLRRADSYRELEDFDAAMADAQEALELEGVGPDIRAQSRAEIARIRDRAGDLKATIEELNRVLAMDDVTGFDRMVAFANRGFARYRLDGDLDGFEADTLEALKIDPTIDVLHYNIGFIAMLRGDWEKATAKYTVALGMAMDVTEGVSSISKEAAKDGAPAEYQVYWGWQLAYMGQMTEGRAKLQAYLDATPNGPLAPLAKSVLATTEAKAEAPAPAAD